MGYFRHKTYEESNTGRERLLPFNKDKLWKFDQCTSSVGLQLPRAEATIRYSTVLVLSPVRQTTIIPTCPFFQDPPCVCAWTCGYGGVRSQMIDR